MYLPLSSLSKICGVPTYCSFHSSEAEVNKANMTSKTLRNESETVQSGTKFVKLPGQALNSQDDCSCIE